MTPEKRIKDQLNLIYGNEIANSTWGDIERIITKYQQNELIRTRKNRANGIVLDERDAILITYGDQLRDYVRTPLQCLYDFLRKYLNDVVSGVHILPFYPYSSDDGFSVIDYRKVNPELGNWEDIENISSDYRLMIDAVINHLSRESDWFKSYLNLEPPYEKYFISVNPEEDLSMVFRPRALPLLTRVITRNGYLHVWTTFSEDQIDLNFGDPVVLLELLDLLLFYATKGAELIRLDAIAYLWKEIGTSCLHLPQTHAVIKIWRAALDIVAPWVVLITETNVPHKENISYFGDVVPETGITDEAQMVYQFPLAPLVLNTFQKSDVTKLNKWAEELKVPAPFLNFIASHDGIGVMPAKGILSEIEIQEIVDQTIAHGGLVSYKSNSDGSESVYELNITLYDWLNKSGNEQEQININRFLASQSIMLSLAGVPGIYFHSFIGSNNCNSCFEETGRARSLNREKLDYEALKLQLDNPESKSSKILKGYCLLLQQRRSTKAFHPLSKQRVLDVEKNVFCLIRKDFEGKENVICLTNVSNNKKEIIIDVEEFGFIDKSLGIDMLSGEKVVVEDNSFEVELAPYKTMWIKFQVE